MKPTFEILLLHHHLLYKYLLLQHFHLYLIIVRITYSYLLFRIPRLLKAKFLVHLFLPPEFSDTSPILAMLAIALFVRWVIIVPSRKVIDVLGRSDISLGLTMVEVLLSISLGLPLIRAFGITGAAAMMLSVSGILALLAIFIVFGLKTKRIALKLPSL